MSDFPDPDEEYELLYADDLELLREDDEENVGNPVKCKTNQAKRSLDFSSPAPKKALTEKTVENNAARNTISDNNEISLTPSLQPIDDLLTSANISNKRTADDLFGDIGDIDFDEVNLPSKRQKTEEENDLELIEKIIEQRKLRQMLLEPSSRLQNSSRSNYGSKENMTLNIPRWPFLPLTNSCGDRVYVRLESEDSWDKSLDIAMEQPSLRASYVGTWEEARKILEAKQQLEIQQSLTQPLPDVDSVASDMNSSSLWVDKYKPESYLELLSEEPVNRALLHWLHLWDKIVFKKEVKTKEPQQRNTFSKRTGQFQFVNKWRGKKDNQPEVDDDGRPHHKVALLCGPPGVGKTTLAHLLAKLAGYRPVELNASDERSTDAFRTALQNATLMRSVLDRDKRPNCLILDEIDGAPLPTVELLVKWCTATGTEPGKKRGKSQSQPLRRPVIAICNDLYATSLRPLRPVSLIVQVGGVSVSRLTARLSLVAVREGLQVHPRALSALAARAAGDVRAAIQVLSFVKPGGMKQLTVEDVENAAIGTKDCTRSMMQALQAIFTVNDRDPQAVLKTIQAAGEYDRIADGIFENYLTSRVDARLLIACETLSWLRLYDAVYSWTLKNQNYSLYGLLPLCCARCHSILASRTPHRVQFPSQARQQAIRKTELDSIVSSVWRGSAPSVATTRKNLTLDILPLLPYLLSPVLRSANVQLCSESERKTLRTCAGAMCEYGLQYTQQRTPEGLYAFVMEPDVYRVAFYGSEERMRPPPPIRQAIAREQQLEIIRRNEEMAGKVTRNPNSTPSRRKSTDVQASQAKPNQAKPSTSKEMKEPALPNHLQRLKPKEVEKKPQGTLPPAAEVPYAQSRSAFVCNESTTMTTTAAAPPEEHSRGCRARPRDYLQSSRPRPRFSINDNLVKSLNDNNQKLQC